MSKADDQAATDGGERIHKVLARAGWGSRREIERWIEAGRIRVNGRRAETGARVAPGDRVQLDDGRVLRVSGASQELHVLAYNKPAGVVCTRRDEQNRPNIFEDLPRLERGRWINIGRLDINTSGLLLFTNHGELAHRLMHPRYRVDREYAARIFGEVEDEMLGRLRDGVDIDGERFHFDDIVEGEGRRRQSLVLLRGAERAPARGAAPVGITGGQGQSPDPCALRQRDAAGRSARRSDRRTGWCAAR
ncbi:MAG: rRNA pseudouridine synthase [Proteobacteria bacterium]|nr:rRNA pseudouridine synthase [Pseudomonadota bacterium]